MRKLLLSLSTLVIICGSLLAFTSSKYPRLQLKEKAPLTKLKMKDVLNGKEYSLDKLKRKNGLLVIFSAHSCPCVSGTSTGFIEGWQGRYEEVYQAAKKNKYGMVLINSSEGDRDGEESLEKLRQQATENNYSMPYLIDTDSQLANAFGAKTTPDVFLLNKKMELVYVGSIDDNVDNSNKVKETYILDAISEGAKGIPITVPKTKNLGCSIKRVSIN